MGNGIVKNLKSSSRQALKVLFLISGAFMSFSSHAEASAKFNPVLEQAKEYAFAACVMYHYDGSPVASEADAWAAGVIENGNLSVDNYAAIAALAKNARVQGMTRDAVPMKLRGCFNFVNSIEFLANIKKITKSRPL